MQVVERRSLTVTGSHEEIEKVLRYLKDRAHSVNVARTDSVEASTIVLTPLIASCDDNAELTDIGIGLMMQPLAA